MNTNFAQVSDNTFARALSNSLNNTTSPITLSGIDTRRFSTITTGYIVTIWDDVTYPNDPSLDTQMEKALITAATIGVSGSITITRPNAKLHAGTPLVAALVVSQHISDHSTAINTLETNNTGINTGDETSSTIKTKLGVTTLSGSNTGDQDLSSYATSASVTSGLATKEPTIATGTTSQYYRGDKSFQTLDKTAVGLSNVDNTSDATKNSAVATLTNKTITAPKIDTLKDTNGNTIIDLLPVASAVNYLQFKNNAATFTPGIIAIGTDTNINVDVTPKGTGRLRQSGVIVPTVSSSDALTNKDFTSGTNTFPTFNQNTTGTASNITGNIPESQVTNLTTDLAGKSPALNPTAVKSSAYTLAANDFVPVDTTSAGVTLTLPTAPANGTRVGAKHIIQGGTNLVTINAGGSDVFNKTGGNTSVTLTLLNQSIQFQYSSGIWYGVAADIGLTALDARYQKLLSLTTTGTSGAATLVGTTLNIPQYTGGGGGSGITRSINAVAASITLAATTLTDYIYFWTGSTAYTLTMPTANSNVYTLKNNSSIAQAVSGSGDITSIRPGDSYDFFHDGTTWRAF